MYNDEILKDPTGHAMDLTQLGWDEQFERQFAPHRAEGRLPARIVREEMVAYRALGEPGEMLVELAMRLRHRAASKAELPAVGDWVAVERVTDDKGRVQAVLPRRSRFSRKVAHTETEEQIIAANIDTVFMVSSLDQDFSVRRIERYLTVIWDSGAEPAVILNKADLCDDAAARVAEVKDAAYRVPVHACSALTEDGLNALRPYLAPGKTVAFVGPSGVGKSTLINDLLGEARQKVGPVHAERDKGRHTTTHRELIRLPGGGMVIDTPGMRELQLWAEEENLEGTFGDIEALSLQCRFNDCAHNTEPGCAVKTAIESGDLEPARLENYRKLQDELRHLATKQDARLKRDQRRTDREFGRLYKRTVKQRKRERGEE